MVCVLDCCSPGFPGGATCSRGLVLGQPPHPCGGALQGSAWLWRCFLPPPPAPARGGVHAPEIGAGFPSPLLLFTSECFCLTSLGCIHFPLFTAAVYCSSLAPLFLFSKLAWNASWFWHLQMFWALHFVTGDFPHFAEFHLVASLFCKTLLLSFPSLNFDIFLFLLAYRNLFFVF